MDIQNTLNRLKAERDYHEQNVRQSIRMLRGILDNVEQNVDNGRPYADDAFQGKEWLLYKSLSDLEHTTTWIKQLELLQKGD